MPAREQCLRVRYPTIPRGTSSLWWLSVAQEVESPSLLAAGDIRHPRAPRKHICCVCERSTAARGACEPATARALQHRCADDVLALRLLRRLVRARRTLNKPATQQGPVEWALIHETACATWRHGEFVLHSIFGRFSTHVEAAELECFRPPPPHATAPSARASAHTSARTPNLWLPHARDGTMRCMHAAAGERSIISSLIFACGAFLEP